MPEIVIRLTVPEGCTVRVEGLQGAATGRGEGRGGGGAPRGNGSPRGAGSASEKQRKLIFARAKAADVPLEVVLDHLGIASLDALDWQMVETALTFIAAGGVEPAPPPADGGSQIDDSSIPF